MSFKLSIYDYFLILAEYGEAEDYLEIDKPENHPAYDEAETEVKVDEGAAVADDNGSVLTTSKIFVVQFYFNSSNFINLNAYFSCLRGCWNRHLHFCHCRCRLPNSEK